MTYDSASKQAVLFGGWTRGTNEGEHQHNLDLERHHLERRQLFKRRCLPE